MFIRIIKTLYYDRIDVLKELIFIKQVHQKRVIFVYFLNNSFKFQPDVCNRCHDLLMMSINFSDISFLNINGSDYHCIISLISKDKDVNFLQNGDLTEKIGTL